MIRLNRVCLQVDGTARSARLRALLLSERSDRRHALVIVEREAAGDVARVVTRNASAVRRVNVHLRNGFLNEVDATTYAPTLAVSVSTEVSTICRLASDLRNLSVIGARRIRTRTIGVRFVGPMLRTLRRGLTRREPF